MSIVAIYPNKDIHTATENKIIYGMNMENTLIYGFVNDAISKWLLTNLNAQSGNNLWDIVVSRDQKSHKDGNIRDYYGIVCHSHHDKNILWKDSPEIIGEALDSRYFAGKDVASLIIGSGLMGGIGGANITEILRAMDKSQANVSLYTLWWMENILALQLWMERIDRQWKIYNTLTDIREENPNIIPLIVPWYEPRQKAYA